MLTGEAMSCQGAGTDAAPPASVPAPATAPAAVATNAGGCQNDSQCKGDRICVHGECTDPPAKPPAGEAP